MKPFQKNKIISLKEDAGATPQNTAGAGAFSFGNDPSNPADVSHGSGENFSKNEQDMNIFKSKKKKLTEGEASLPTSNLFLLGSDRDVNGNRIVKLTYPNQRAFSIQIDDGFMKNTADILRGNPKPESLGEKALEKIEKEMVQYIQKFGSARQKDQLKTY